MKTHFDNAWKDWIIQNLVTGGHPDVIFKILSDEGFEYNAIKRELNYEPTIPLELIPNPLRLEQAKVAPVGTNVGVRIDPAQMFIPNAKKLDTNKAEFYVLEDFLNEDECRKIVDLIKTKMEPSTLSSYEADQSFRTSRTCQLGHRNSPFMQSIDERICKILGIHSSHGEVIQGQYYKVGQEFKPHTDYFEPHEMATHGGRMGQRTYTFMIYLNDVTEGGETEFPELGQSLTPKMGTAVIWNSLNPDGSPNYSTLHHAKPVTKGYKAVITKWFRSNSAQDKAPPMYTKEANEYVPNYTKAGFQKKRLPEALFKEIRVFFDNNKERDADEYVPGDFIYSSSKKKSAASSTLMDLPEHLRQKIHDALKPMMEEWCGEDLDPTYVYGIRTYKDKAVLRQHRDKLETHIISAIINIDQNVKKDWPLVIDDNYYREHHVILKPGDIVLYEGARLKHGRPIPFNGRSFSNIFCHFKPKAYKHPVL